MCFSVCLCVCGFRGVSICILVYLPVTVACSIALCALITENTYLWFIINIKQLKVINKATAGVTDALTGPITALAVRVVVTCS